MDFVTGLPPSEGNKAILTVLDRFSKMVHFIQIPILPSAKETAELLLQHAFRLHGLPCNIVSDWGPQFTAHFWAEFCCLQVISVSLSSGFHPQSNGQSERLNQELETGLCLLCSLDPEMGVRNVVWVELAHNSLPSSATGLTPFQTSYGYQPLLFSSQEAEVMVPSTAALVQRCHLSWRRARQTLQNSSYEKWANKCSSVLRGPEGLAF